MLTKEWSFLMKKFDFTIVKNPEIVQENTLPAHSDHVCMPNWFEGEHNSFRMSLDGLWKFSYAKNMDLAVNDFEKENYSCKGWDEIRVPAHIQAEGYDTCPWEVSENVMPGEIPMEYNPVASYVKYFTLPVNMRGARVCISFQGVESGFALWVNGQYVGYSENTFEPVEFELTPYLKEGENKLAVRVWKWTSSNWNAEQDFEHFSGIFDSVYLYMVPRTHLWDVQIVPELSEDLSEATLTIITTSCGKGEVEVRLLDGTMESVLEGVMAIEEGEEGSDEIQSGIAGMVYQPKLWSAEEPNLYVLQLEVRDENGDLTEVTSQYVGFRRLERQDGKMTLNGKEILFKEGNLSAFRADRGGVPGREEVVEDIATMKQNNIDTMRVCRYLNASYIYELCDEYGLYMITDGVEHCSQNAKNHPSMIKESVEKEHFHEIMCESLTNLQEIKYIYQNISVEFSEKTFIVWNKSLFTNTDVYDASVILQKDGQSIAKVDLPISVEPLEKKIFDIPQQLFDIMDNLKIASVVHDGVAPEFAITVSFTLPADNLWGKRGLEVAFDQHVYKKEVAPYSCKEPFEVVRGKNAIAIKGRHFKAMFSTREASLVSYIYGGVEMLKSVPQPNFWRASVNHDNKKLLKQGYAQWKLASLYAATKNLEIAPILEEMEDSAKLTYTYDMPTNPASSCQVSYHVFGDGTIETTMVYEPVEGLCDMPEFGMMFKMDAEFDHLRWYGLGPDETDSDYMCGGKLGIYENKVADNMAKYYASQECGKKCGVRFAEITNSKGRGMRFFGDELTFCALPYTPHELENAGHVYELPEVHNTVVRVALQYLQTDSKKKVFTFCFRGV